MHGYFFAWDGQLTITVSPAKVDEPGASITMKNNGGPLVIHFDHLKALVAFGEKIATEGRRLLGEEEETVCLADILAAPAANPFA